MIFRLRSRCVMAVAWAAVLANAPLSADIVWTGLGSNLNWTTNANWQGGSAPLNDGTEQILFGSAAVKSVVLVNSAQSIRRLRFDFSSGTTTAYSLLGLGGATLTLGGDGIEVISGSTVSLSTLSRTGLLSSSTAGLVTFGSSLGLVLGTSQTWQVGANSALVVSGVVSGSGKLTLAGDGYTTLSGNNTYSGGTVIQSGKLGLEHDSALGTGSLTVSGNATLYTTSGVRTIANALNLNSSFLDLLPYGGNLSFTGPVTLGANTTVRNNGYPVYFTGAIGETGGARSFTIAGNSAVVLSGVNTYTGGTSVQKGALLFSNATAIPAVGTLSSSSSGYIGVGFTSNIQSGFIAKLSSAATFGAIGFDTDPSAISATTFAEPIDLSALTSFAQIGTATRAIFSSTAIITPTTGAGYRFGGGGGTLRIDSKLTGTNGVTVGSSAGLPLTLVLTNTGNDYSGVTSVTDSALIFGPGAASSASANGSYVLGATGYIGSMDPTLSLSAWLARFASTNLDGVIGFDSADLTSPRTITGNFALSSFTGGVAITLGTATAATLTGTITLPPIQTDYYLTGYKGGWLSVDLALTGGHGVKIGSASGDYPEYDPTNFARISTVFLNGSNSYTNGTSLFSGRLVLGNSNALGTGALTVDGSGANVYPVLETSLTTSPSFANQLVVKNAFEIGGVNSFTWSGNILNGASTGVLRKMGASNLTLAGNNSGFSGGFLINEGTLTFASDTATGTGGLELGSTNATAAFTTAAPSLNGLASDSATSRVNLASGTTLTINQTSSSTFRGQIQDAGAIVKAGAGTLRLESASTFTGGTTITAGAINAANSAALGTGLVTLNGATSQLKVDAGATLANSIAFGVNGGRLSGAGGFSSGIVLGTNSVVAPGSPVGTLAFANGLTLGSGSSYDFEMQNAAGSPGTGWDVLQVTGPLAFTANVNSPVTLNLISLNSDGTNGNASNFVATNSYSWSIASATSLTGFNATAFTINAANFTNALNGGVFSLSTSGTNLLLNFTPVPEPSTWALIIAGLGVAGMSRLRRRR